MTSGDEPVPEGLRAMLAELDDVAHRALHTAYGQPGYPTTPVQLDQWCRAVDQVDELLAELIDAEASIAADVYRGIPNA